MRCREALIAFVKEASGVVEISQGMTQPKASDYNGWSDLIANAIASGASAERHRSYLKSVAKSTWELVNWLTHSSNATQFDAYFAFEATGHVLSSWSLSVTRFELALPDRCPRCCSYQLETRYEQDNTSNTIQLKICRVCEWQSEPVVASTTLMEKSNSQEIEPTEKDNLGPCIFVDVPLRGPKPPKPSQ